jgi:hypothetical protein
MMTVIASSVKQGRQQRQHVRHAPFWLEDNPHIPPPHQIVSGFAGLKRFASAGDGLKRQHKRYRRN